jgi:hypothetical protein
VTTLKRIFTVVVLVAVAAVGFVVFRPKDSGHH